LKVLTTNHNQEFSAKLNYTYVCLKCFIVNPNRNNYSINDKLNLTLNWLHNPIPSTKKQHHQPKMKSDSSHIQSQSLNRPCCPLNETNKPLEKNTSKKSPNTNRKVFHRPKPKMSSIKTAKLQHLQPFICTTLDFTNSNHLPISQRSINATKSLLFNPLHARIHWKS